MSTILRSALLAASVAAAVFSAPSQAAQIIGGSLGLGDPNTDSTINVQNFDTNSGVGSYANSQFAHLTFAATNKHFVSDALTLTNLSGDVIANFISSPNENSAPEVFTTISFDAPITEAAFAFASDADFSVFLWIEAYLDASLVDTLDPTAYYGDYSNKYYGFTGIGPFNKIVISNFLDPTGYYIDNLQTRNVPEPETLALLGLGLLGLAATRRRQRV